ncbi:MAG: beta-ketoacyl synthase N-terminal-like domain-containing protein, partial [Pseudomonadota bacterium]|nr:beta-ketoacyl synthase N-terminal-like domain-containing protein [Pseudomonadota bacterium]
MRRVAITGIGIVSCIGNSTADVSDSLKNGKSGISRADNSVELGFKSQIYGMPTLDIEAAVDKRVRRFMGEGAAWNYVAMEQAIADAGLEENDIISPMTGLVMGSGGPSTRTLI